MECNAQLDKAFEDYLEAMTQADLAYSKAKAEARKVLREAQLQARNNYNRLFGK